MHSAAIVGAVTLVLLLILSRTPVYGQETLVYNSALAARRCAYINPKAGIAAPKGGSEIGDPDKDLLTTELLCAKHCADNEFQLEPNCLLNIGGTCGVVSCTHAVWNPDAATGKCLLYTATAAQGTLAAPLKLITIKTTCPALATTAATKSATKASAAATTKASVAAATTKATVKATTKAAASKTATTAASTGTAGDKSTECCAWAKKGECDINPFYMKLQCKGSCGTPTATTADANTVASNPPALCKPTGAAALAAKGACKDKDTQCTKWALNQECDKNPYYMKVNCATACRACPDGKPKTFKTACGDTAVGATAGCANSEDSCSFWASIGECTRNAGWMVTHCCAACRNQKIVFQNCPLAGKSKFTGQG